MSKTKELFSNVQIKRLIIPIIIEQVLLVSVGLTNTVMVSGIGEYAVSAVSLIEGINLLLLNIFTALATGGAVVVSQFLGQQNVSEAKQASKQLILSTAVLSFVITIVCLVFSQEIISLAFGKIEADVMMASRTYFFYSALSYPFIALYNAGAAVFRAMGNSKISMYNSVIMNVINVVLSVILIFVFHLGVLGVAIASLVSRIIASGMILTMLRNPNNLIFINNYLHYKFNFDYIKKILTIGVPSGLENGMFQLGKIMVQALITTFGTYAIAANAVANMMGNIMIIPGLAMSTAMVVVVGQCVGAREYEQATAYVKKLLKIAYVLMLVLSTTIVGLSPWILKIFHLSPEATTLAWQCILLHGVVGIFLWPAAFTLPNALRAANDAKFTMLVSVASMWLFRYLLSFFIANTLGLELLGVWIAMCMDWVVRAAIFVWRFLSGKWQQKSLV